MDCAWNADDKHCGYPWLRSAAACSSVSQKGHLRVLLSIALHARLKLSKAQTRAHIQAPSDLSCNQCGILPVPMTEVGATDKC